MCVCMLTPVWLFSSPWTVTHNAPLFMGLFQGKILDCVSISSSRGFCWPGLNPRLPHCRRVLNHSATGKAPTDTALRCAQSLSRVRLFGIPWTVARQAPLSMGILYAGVLEWVAKPSSRESSQPWDQTQISRTMGGLYTIWASREAHRYSSNRLSGNQQVKNR